MNRKVAAFKRKFDRGLKHIKVILLHKKKAMPHDQWLLLVNQTKLAMIDDPSEFWCGELPSSEITRAAIEEVFQGFLEDQRIRDVQNRSTPWFSDQFKLNE